MSRETRASKSIRLVTRDGILLAPVPELVTTEDADRAIPQDAHDGVFRWILQPLFLIELACCLVFAATIVVVGCAYVIATRALWPILLQNYDLVW
ncbi:hypothetical protein [Rhizobium sp. WYCCWR10014]|uniref:hypothetical protein n=1 Tax=Rhizobium sp. WYCCWR10014 TaxID=1825933 RepID=UPI0007E30529|nr:hypothetical protein [Rhizobium sp. WYCCWR10014]OAV52078.1 hypothetical protein A6U98_00210 [Rhizobium sp. WYCCWR10014]